MNNVLLLLVVFTISCLNSGLRNEVEAGAHELVPFRSSWYRNVEKSRQVEETPIYVDNNEGLAEYANVRPRKVKNKDNKVINKRTEEKIKKSHEIKKKTTKKKKKRKRKKKPVRNPRRFVKTTNVERDKESNMTDSIEVIKKANPVDIIVHIKVNE